MAYDNTQAGLLHRVRFRLFPYLCRGSLTSHGAGFPSHCEVSQRRSCLQGLLQCQHWGRGGGADDKVGMRALEVQDPDPPPSSDLVKSGPCQSTGQGPDHHLKHQPTNRVSKDEACWSSPGSVYILPA